MKQVIWFKANEHKTGWRPATWQGWVVWCLNIGLNVAALVIFFPLVLERWTSVFVYGGVFVLINSTFLWVCFKTGEPVTLPKRPGR
jgi:hypothetical protein